ncbi:MAG: serine/threonine-protein kinase [Candidatus Saccharimonadales bacterium]
MEGKTVGEFLVGDYIGRGSFGTVYKASKDGVTYAIKFIDMLNIATAYDSPKRLDREIEALKRVKSKYTVEYIDDGYYSENHIDYKYIVMEYVDGKTLDKIIQEDPLPWSNERAISFTQELLAGLDIVHKQSLVHRDLKFDNIAICKDGQLKIIDYGLSKIIDFSTLTQSGMMIGAPHFMSPEQILDGKHITYLSDYYAVGVILYALLTGQLLFESVSSQEITYKTVNVKPPLPSIYNPKIPTHVENALLRLLAKQPFERYKTTEDMITALTVETTVQLSTGVNKVKFYPRLMTGDTKIIETLLDITDLDGVDYPIHEHKPSKRLDAALKSKKEAIDFIADPGTNRMVYTGFRKTISLKNLPYAPQGFNPYEVEDFEDPEKVRDFVKSVIDLQVVNKCNIITAPYFYFSSASDDWFKINIQLLRASNAYIRAQYPSYRLSAAICTSAETLSRRKEQKLILDNYCSIDYESMQLYVDSIQESTNDAQLYNYIQTGLKIKEFTKAKIIACRVPAVGLGLLTVGFDAITSGLAVLDTFNKSIIEKDKDMAQMPIKHYFADLLLAVTVKSKEPSGLIRDIMGYEDELKEAFPQYTLNLTSKVPDSVKDGLSEHNQVPKLDFLISRTAEISEINAAEIKDRRDNFVTRIDQAIELRKALVKRGIKLSGTTDGLKTWKEVLKQF